MKDFIVCSSDVVVSTRAKSNCLWVVLKSIISLESFVGYFSFQSIYHLVRRLKYLKHIPQDYHAFHKVSVFVIMRIIKGDASLQIAKQLSSTCIFHEQQ